ncbi:MAG: LTA synthase family protein, partial [Polyangiaceae bacterium]
MKARLARIGRFIVGERPRSLFVLLLPTLAALIMDFTIRARTIAAFWIGGKAIYFSSLLVSSAFWALPLFLASRLFASNSVARRIGRVAFFALFVWPLATFSYGGQALYFHIFHVYIGRDTVRLGIALRGTVGDWFNAWGGPLVLVVIALVGAVLTIALYFRLKMKAPGLSRSMPWILVPLFCASIFCFWTDNVDSRFLQAAVPDACFIHGCIHALRAKVTGKWNERQGVSIRTPAPLPPLASTRAKKPNVLLIMTESVRADAICSDPKQCKDETLDLVAPDRITLGNLRTQTPNTFSACMVLWSGLAPNVDFRSAHTAPLLWELAKAVGYRTIYVTSQNPNFEDFGAYVRKAGIDTLEMGSDLGGMTQEQLGAPDERATAEMLRVLHSTTEPFFAVMQFSNTHFPYRTDPSLLPHRPESDNPLGPRDAYKNHYLNAVLFQEKTLANFLSELRTLPAWDNTVVLFVSDHGEELRDHGGLYHNHAIYDEQLKIPGFMLAGKNALTDADRAALASYRFRHTYAQDVHATIEDLFGVYDARETLPLASFVRGRSLVRVADGIEPTMLLTTSTSVW